MDKSTTINLSAALSIFEDHLPDIRKACVENIRHLQQTHQPAKELDVDGDWTVEDIQAHVNKLLLDEKTRHYLQTIKRIDGRKRHYNKDDITEADIDRAREYPIAELFTEITGETPRHSMVHCPFHDDHRPSMSLRKHNRYKCFGCDASGDVIDLYMKVNGVDFITAVKKLCGMI